MERFDVFKKHIKLEKAGTLGDKIKDNYFNTLTHLKVSGTINSADFRTLKPLCTSEIQAEKEENYTVKKEEPPYLREIDLADSHFQSKELLTNFTFFSKLESLSLPQGLRGTDDSKVFENSKSLWHVKLPDSLEELGYGTFLNCDQLADIKLPNGLKRIGSFAFGGCRALRKMEIPDTVQQVGLAAFGGCIGIEEFIIGEDHPYFSVKEGVLFSKDGQTLIAYPGGRKSKNYDIPEGVVKIGEGAFLDTPIENIQFPSSLEAIGGWAFRFCDNIRELFLPDRLREIGELAFEYCSRINKIKFSNQLEELKTHTFGGLEYLKEVEIPGSIKTLGKHAFGWSNSIEKIKLNEGLEELHDQPDCEALQEVNIPQTVSKIESGLFRKNKKIDAYDLDINNPYYKSGGGALLSKDGNRLVAVVYNENKTLTVPEGIEVIEDFVLEGFEKIETIVLPNSLKEIGKSAFEGCLGLKTLLIGDSLKKVQASALHNCPNLTNIYCRSLRPPKILYPSKKEKHFLTDAKEVVLQVPEAKVSKYRRARGWKQVLRIKAWVEND